MNTETKKTETTGLQDFMAGMKIRNSDFEKDELIFELANRAGLLEDKRYSYFLAAVKENRKRFPGGYVEMTFTQTLDTWILDRISRQISNDDSLALYMVIQSVKELIERGKLFDLLKAVLLLEPKPTEI